MKVILPYKLHICIVWLPSHKIKFFHHYAVLITIEKLHWTSHIMLTHYEDNCAYGIVCGHIPYDQRFCAGPDYVHVAIHSIHRINKCRNITCDHSTGSWSLKYFEPIESFCFGFICVVTCPSSSHSFVLLLPHSWLVSWF